jgi:glycerol uptake facilitator-like aquaporin
MRPTTPARLLAEFLGTALLVAVVVGSGIAAQRLSPDDVGLQLLENAIATAAGLAAFIVAFGPVSGAHFNPVVTLVDAAFGGITWSLAAGYAAVQFVGGALGAVVGNLMFSEPAVELSTKARSGEGLRLAEAVATFGLLVVVFGVVRTRRPSIAPFAVGGYIGAAYFFTSSTSFVNPAVTAARMLTDTFAGIKPSSVAAFVVFQLVGAAVAAAVIRVLYPAIEEFADEAVVPHQGDAHG